MVTLKWAIEIDHYRQTFLKKPGALANSLALLQAAPELKKIYTNHYIGSEKDFIELLEIISTRGLAKVEQAIVKLNSISPGAINTDKIKMIAQRDDDTHSIVSKGENQIEIYSKQILSNYAAILSSSAKEAELV